jgi:hypothetical protein
METVSKYSVADVIHVAILMEDKASIQRPHQFLATNSLKKLLLERRGNYILLHNLDHL